MNLVGPQKGPALRLGCSLAVNPILVGDIGHQAIVVPPINGERGVALLPPCSLSLRERLANPTHRIGLDGRDEHREADGGWHLDVEMDMIAPAPTGEQVPA